MTRDIDSFVGSNTSSSFIYLPKYASLLLKEGVMIYILLKVLSFLACAKNFEAKKLLPELRTADIYHRHGCLNAYLVVGYSLSTPCSGFLSYTGNLLLFIYIILYIILYNMDYIISYCYGLFIMDYY